MKGKFYIAINGDTIRYDVIQYNGFVVKKSFDTFDEAKLYCELLNKPNQ
jgi:hypothetical protein